MSTDLTPLAIALIVLFVAGCGAAYLRGFLGAFLEDVRAWRRRAQ